MAKEIERKFLMNDAAFVKLLEEGAMGIRMKQGYLCTLSEENQATVRLRRTDEGWKLTIKGPATGASKDEFEYDVSPVDGVQMWDLCKHQVDKVRYKLPVGRYIFEIDVFKGKLDGLVVAEIELDHVDDVFYKPDWLGREVTEDFRYSNANLGKLDSLGDLPLK